MISRIAQWNSFGPARWLRVIGVLVLICGLGGAFLMHRRAQAMASARTMEDLMPGYAQARARERGILMGSFFAELMDYFDALREPDTQAIILAVGATITALGCFRVASIIRR